MQSVGNVDLGVLLAIIGIFIPVAAFLWEFVVSGRKWLGYRVQMDTPVKGGSRPEAPAC